MVGVKGGNMGEVKGRKMGKGGKRERVKGWEKGED
jgi:hypothetical protein